MRRGRSTDVNLPLVADVAVVGAGLTGASTALHLAEQRPDLDVVLLEASRVATGASGHGTGLLGPRLGPPIDVARRRDGDLVVRQRYLDSVAAVQRVLELVGRHLPSAVQPVAGQLVVAATAAEAAVLRRRAASYATLGLDVTLAATDDPWAAATRTALLYGPAASVDPGLLTRGLVACAVGLGVRLQEDTPVRRLEQGSAEHGVRVVTARGVLHARSVVLAVDVTDRLQILPQVAVQLPLQVSASQTAPLPPDLLAALGGPTTHHVISTAALGPYRRIAADGSVVLGGGPTALLTGATTDSLATTARRAWAWQRRQLDLLHPDLAAVPIIRRWSGPIGLTRDGLPVIGRLSVPGLAPGSEVWGAGGWNGHGLAATVDAGHRLAASVLTGERSAALHRRRWHLAAPAAVPVVRAALRLQTPRPPQTSPTHLSAPTSQSARTNQQIVRGSTASRTVSRARTPAPTLEESRR